MAAIEESETYPEIDEGVSVLEAGETAPQMETVPHSPLLTPEKKQEEEIFQAIVDEAEEPGLDLEEEMAAEDPKSPERKRRPRKREDEVLREGRPSMGIRAEMDGHFGRYNQSTIMPFVVNQGSEGTCAYVTLAKVLIYNLMGLIMDIEIPYDEKMKLHHLMKHWPVTSETKMDDRFLQPYGRCSDKGYMLILCFFYFFDWIKKHDMRPYYLRGATIPREVTSLDIEKRFDFNTVKIPELFSYLQLKVKRLGGRTFTGSGWIQHITTALEEKAGSIKWKRTNFCALSGEFSTGSTTLTHDTYPMFLKGIIEPITTKGIKVILTLYNKTHLLHDVMLVGLEKGSLLISNSWGHAIDVIKIESLPYLTLKKSPVEWLIFQFTFLLPIRKDDYQLEGLRPQYDFNSYGEFKALMDKYDPPTFPKTSFTAAQLGQKGGKKTKRKRRNKTKRRNKKTFSRV
jgi:hypothetical protein